MRRLLVGGHAQHGVGHPKRDRYRRRALKGLNEGDPIWRMQPVEAARAEQEGVIRPPSARHSLSGGVQLPLQ
jgi:hypothetical protein